MSARGSGNGGRGRGGRPAPNRDEPYGRGGGRGRGGGERGGRGGGNPPPPLRADTVSTATIKAPPAGSSRVLPHLFGGARSAPGANASEAAGVADRLAEVTLKAPSNPAHSTPAKDATTNLFPVTVEQDKAVYQYDLVVVPECRPRLRASLVREALGDQHRAVTVRRNIVYSAIKLHKGEEPLEKTVSGQGNLGPFTVTLKFTTTVPTEGNGGFSTDQYTLWASILAGALESVNLTRIGGLYYDLDDTLSKKSVYESNEFGAVCLTPGLRVALMPLQKGLFLQVDLVTRVTRVCTVLDELNRMKKAEGAKWKEVANEELTGVIAATNYSRESRKQTFKVTKVRFDMNPATVIPQPPNAASPGPNKSRTFAQYMKEVNNITVRDLGQPLLECTSATEKYPDGSPVVRYFIPELSRLVGQTKKMLADTELQRALKEKCLVPSTVRFQRVFDIVKNLTTSQPAFKDAIAAWGISVKPELAKVPTRIMKNVAVKDGNGEAINNDKNPRSWLIEKGTKLPTLPKAPTVWTFAFPDNLEKPSSDFLDTLLTRTINGVGGGWPKPQMLKYRSPGRNPDAILKEFKRNVLPEVDEGAKFLLAVLPTNDEKVYAEVKKQSLCDWSIPSQCVVFNNVRNERNRLNVSSRVGGQMLVKAGGTLWTPESKGGSLGNALLCAVDFERAPPGGKEKNVMGLVAVASRSLEYIGEFSETFNDSAGSVIRDSVKKALEAYKKKIGKEPSTIVMYRSGMDEGDVPRIVQQEVAPILKECKELRTKLCFLASLKRSHTRLLECKSGTIIDKDVLPHTGFSFFMVPQHVNIGTATAMKFTTLHNSDPNLTGEELERLTFQLCHHFAGWWGVTREPSLVMYAKRLAKLAFITRCPVTANTGSFLVL